MSDCGAHPHWLPAVLLVAGPAHPFRKAGLAAGLKNHRTGQVEDLHLAPAAFETQYLSFDTAGVAAAPSGAGVVRAVIATGDGYARSGMHPHTGQLPVKRRRTAEERAAVAEARRQAQEEAAAAVAAGTPFTITTRAPWADKQVTVRHWVCG